MDRVLPVFAGAASSFGGGVTVIAQSIFDTSADSLERIIGGSVLLVVGYFLTRWMFRLLDAVRTDATDSRAMLLQEREAWAQERQAWVEERDAWRRELDAVRDAAVEDRVAARQAYDQLAHELADLTAKYRAEVQYRESLERAGIIDQRHRLEDIDNEGDSRE